MSEVNQNDDQLNAPQSSLSDKDLQIMLARAIDDGSFSILDFQNCNIADLQRLRQLAEEKMAEVPAGQLEESKKRILLLCAITREIISRAKQESTALQVRIDVLNAQCDQNQDLLDDMSARAEAVSARLSGVITEAQQGVLDAGIAIAQADQALAD